MTVYLLRRLYQALIVFFVVTLIVFMVLHISGDPVELLMPPDATPKDMEEMRRTLGLDKPIMVQYGFFLKNAVQGNLGVSYHHGSVFCSGLGQLQRIIVSAARLCPIVDALAQTKPELAAAQLAPSSIEHQAPTPSASLQ